MKKSIAAIALSYVLLSGTLPQPVRAGDDELHGPHTKHVLLISIDGMHAVDFENCVALKTCPHLAALGKNGVTYTRTTTSRPSDSFPGLMALVTGGSPRTVGAFYDVAYDRVLATRFGVAAMEAVTMRRFGEMVALQAGEIVLVPLAEALREPKLLDRRLFELASIFFG